MNATAFTSLMPHAMNRRQGRMAMAATKAETKGKKVRNKKGGKGQKQKRLGLETKTFDHDFRAC